MKASSFLKTALTWIVGHKTLVLIITTVIVLVFGAIKSRESSKWQKEHLRLEGKLEEQQKNHNAFYESWKKDSKKRQMNKTAEEARRAELRAENERMRQESAKAKHALEQEKKKTATLPANKIVIQINERIGEESELTAAGLFLFTRVGVNKTLDRFKEGEFLLSEYTKCQEAALNHAIEIESFNTSISDCEEAGRNSAEGWNSCRATLEIALADIDALEHVEKSMIWKGRLQGAAAGSIITIVGLKLLGIF